MKFKLFSTEIIISYTLICIVALSIILNSFSTFIYCLTSVLIHESGHITAMCVFECPPKKIKISPFEISISDTKRNERTLAKNTVIIILGPIFNFVCFILFYLLYLFYNDIFIAYAAANLSVGLFNSLPVMSLDGGQFLFIALCRFLSEYKAERAVNVITFIFIFPLSALGFVLLFNSAYNFSLLFVCVYLIFSLIFKNNRYY